MDDMEAVFPNMDMRNGPLYLLMERTESNRKDVNQRAEYSRTPLSVTGVHF